VNCAEFKENAAAYALGALTPEERAAFEAHLAEPIAHEGCAEALAEANDTTALLAAAQPPLRPGEHVWQAIEREIGATAPARGAARPATRRSNRREIVAWSLAAAASVLAFVLGREYAVSERRVASKDRELQGLASAETDRQICLNELTNARVSLREKEAALALMGEPGTQLVKLAPQGAEPWYASALLNPDQRSAMVLTRELKPQQGKDYQLWLIRGDEKISAGILRTDAAGTTLARISDQALSGGRPDAFAVTIEPEGGMPQPTGPIILLGKVPTV